MLLLHRLILKPYLYTRNTIMSGLEIAGLVLGAFPIAIEALDRYREVARRMRFWANIAAEHKKCDSKLKFQQALYIHNLRRLLLPMLSIDDASIEALLRDPGGDAWKIDDMARLLQERLGLSYDPYLQCIERLKEAMGNMKREVLPNTSMPTKVDEDAVSDARSRSTKLKAKAEWQLYRVRFSQGETERERLFVELQDCNGSLKTLLQISEDDVGLAQQRSTASRMTAMDAAICGFWKQASKLFNALATTWTCNCQMQHSTKLLLKHRTSADSDFDVLFEKLGQTEHEVRKVRIIERENHKGSPIAYESITQSTQPVHQPTHRTTRPFKSAIRPKVVTNETEPVR